MLDWLQDSLQPPANLKIPEVAACQVISFVLGCLVAVIYHATRRRDAAATQSFAATLVLLAILLALVTQVVGGSVARAFSLAGVLAIVRFRTMVEDTRDTAFVIFAVVVGMAVGAGMWQVALVGLGVGGTAAFLVRPLTAWRASAPAATLGVRLGTGIEPTALLDSVFGKYLTAWRIQTITTARQGAALDLTYQVRLRSEAGVTGLVGELNRLEGVQNVEFRRE